MLWYNQRQMKEEMLCHDIELGDKADRNGAELFYPCVPFQSHRVDTSQQFPQECEEGVLCIVSTST